MQPVKFDNLIKSKMIILKGINWFYPEILFIEESWNSIGPEVQLATSNQKW